ALGGRREELLRGWGQRGVAEEWRRGDVPGRLAGLAAVSESIEGQRLLSTPTADQVSQTLLATGLDAVVYLVPPASPNGPWPAAKLDGGPLNVPVTGVPVAGGPASDGTAAAPGHALMVHPGFYVELIELPGMATGPGTPVASYLAAFESALAVQNPNSRQPGGFRGTAEGRGWGVALDELGRWG